MFIKKRFSINKIYAKTIHKEYSTSHEFTQLHQQGLGDLEERC